MAATLDSRLSGGECLDQRAGARPGLWVSAANEVARHSGYLLEGLPTTFTGREHGTGIDNQS
jgi:hypothetical protein